MPAIFRSPLGHLTYNYFGGNFGGPVKKNKLFFFADYLKVFDHETNTNRISIPTMAIRTGDLSSSATAIYNPFSGNRTAQAASKSLPLLRPALPSPAATAPSTHLILPAPTLQAVPT